MGEFDAFGRKKDEDTMSDLGWGATGEAPPPVEVSASPTVSSTPSSPSPSADWSPANPTTSPSSFGSPPRRRSGGARPILWLVQLCVLAAIAGGIYLAVDAGNDAVDKVRDGFNTFTTEIQTSTTRTTETPTDVEGSTPPTQVEPRKLFTAQGFSDAVKVMERETPGKLSNLSIRADRVNYQLQRGRQYSVVNFNADADVPEVVSKSERDPAAATDGFRYGQIDVGAPARLIRSAGARLNKARADVDYLVMQNIGTIRWIVYFKAEGGSTPKYAIGDSQGRVTQVY